MATDILAFFLWSWFHGSIILVISRLVLDLPGTYHFQALSNISSLPLLFPFPTPYLLSVLAIKVFSS
jgi:hypothetical protein